MTREIPRFSGETGRLSIQVTPEMVKQFSELTGDYSSLHVDPAFGRRSAYRRNVVHGMLPILFLSEVPAIRMARTRGTLRRLAARFVRPMFSPVSLVLEAEPDEDGSAESDDSQLSFKISDSETGIVFTTGSVALADAKGDAITSEKAPGSAPSLVIDKLDEKTYGFGDVARGTSEAFNFRIEAGHSDMLQSLLDSGTGTRTGTGRGVDLRRDDRVAASWLGVSLLSTLVGMCLPGRRATFLEFQLSLSGAIVPARTYTLSGTVRFASAATETIIEDLAITSGGDSKEAVARGKATVKINPSPVQMPTTEMLRGEALDAGIRDKVVLVTGASRGIGETTAKLFSLHGALVVVNYLESKESAERVVQEIRYVGGEAIALQADVSMRDAVFEMVEEVGREYGPVDILVNSAVRNFTPTGFLELTWDEFQKDLDVVLAGAVHTCHAVIPGMIERGGGAIINLSTIAAEAPPPGQSKYVAAKSALAGLTRSLAVEFAPQNIRVNMVVPSMVETDLTQHIPRVLRVGMKNDIPLGRTARPEDVAKAIVFLASSWSSYTTGQKLSVTGGVPPFL